MDPDRLWMAVQLGRDLIGRFAQSAHHAFFLLILRCSRFHLLGHFLLPPLNTSTLYFSTNEERSTSILNEGCTRPKRWLPCRQNGDVAHIYQILPCAKASLLIQYWRNCAATCS